MESIEALKDVELNEKFCRYLLDKFPENPDESILYKYFEKNLDYSRIYNVVKSDIRSLFRSLAIRIHKYIKSRYSYAACMMVILNDWERFKYRFDLRTYNEIVTRINSEISSYNTVYPIHKFYTDIIQWMKKIVNYPGTDLYGFIKDEMHEMCDDYGKMDNLETHFRRNVRTNLDLNNLYKSITGNEYIVIPRDK